MRKIDHIVIHCTAGYGNRQDIERFWRETLKWRVPGYHFLIEQNGTVHQLSALENVTNGVRGFNSSSIHISYIGGVDPKNVNRALDSRTEAQKAAIIDCIRKSLAWAKQYQATSQIKILGHRDFSPDKNGDGIIEAWERIKECPSFDAIREYQWRKI